MAGVRHGLRLLRGASRGGWGPVTLPELPARGELADRHRLAGGESGRGSPESQSVEIPAPVRTATRRPVNTATFGDSTPPIVPVSGRTGPGRWLPRQSLRWTAWVGCRCTPRLSSHRLSAWIRDVHHECCSSAVPAVTVNRAMRQEFARRAVSITGHASPIRRPTGISSEEAVAVLQSVGRPTGQRCYVRNQIGPVMITVRSPIMDRGAHVALPGRSLNTKRACPKRPDQQLWPVTVWLELAPRGHDHPHATRNPVCAQSASSARWWLPERHTVGRGALIVAFATGRPPTGRRADVGGSPAVRSCNHLRGGVAVADLVAAGGGSNTALENAVRACRHAQPERPPEC